MLTNLLNILQTLLWKKWEIFETIYYTNYENRKTVIILCPRYSVRINRTLFKHKPNDKTKEAKILNKLSLTKDNLISDNVFAIRKQWLGIQKKIPTSKHNQKKVLKLYQRLNEKSSISNSLKWERLSKQCQITERHRELLIKSKHIYYKSCEDEVNFHVFY